ncbi:MAG: hypothetical protein IPI30_18910 [Saprospiraceae bacterium]|nr:hypothetical protein [Candidatus Vicinibacter affinis]
MLTEETLWKLGRAPLEDVSPDGGSVVYSVTYFNIVANKGNTDLYVCKTDGTTPPVKITNYEGHENNARFRRMEKKILFLANGLLYSCNPDGSDQYKLADLEMNGFVIAPTNDRIAFLQDVKYRKTTAETYPACRLQTPVCTMISCIVTGKPGTMATTAMFLPSSIKTERFMGSCQHRE